MSDIQHLFDLDPLKLTKDHLDEIIKKLREQRASFALGNKTAGKVKKEKIDGKLDLKDLLDL